MPGKYHNLSNEALADEIGRVDAIAKAAEAELAALKDEFKSRGLKQAIGEKTEVTAAEQTANRLDTVKVRAFFGPAIAKYETPIISTVIRVRPALARLDALIAA
jgi:hypothetical protein